TPETEGTYEIIASFAGDASYGSSAAATTVAVGASQTPAAPIEPDTPTTGLISTELAIAIAAIAACIIGAVAFFALRKRK
ncbi:MAG: hypothetical protein CW716_11520, partial [Candidatus Bathyarchaeum sp.]